MDSVDYKKLDGLIYKMARTFTNDVNLIEDLYQQGMLGVLKAQKNFNYNQGTEFLPYVKMYIYGEMYDYFNNANKTFKTSKEIIKLYTIINKTSDLLSQELKRKPSLYEIASYLKLSYEQIEYTMKIMQSTLSINYDYDDKSLEDYISYNDSYTNVEINELMNDLPNSEKQIIEYKYYEGYNQEEIAKIMNISQSSVSRYEQNGISRMRKNINSISK